MSDGNFNRSLLPHTPYQSGLRAGKSMARMHALNILQEMLSTINPSLTEDEQKAILDDFRSRLTGKL